MAENISNGFSFGFWIICNLLLGTGNILPHKRLAHLSSIIRPRKQPHALFTGDTWSQNLEFDIISIDQAKSRLDLLKWQAAIEVEYLFLWKHQVFGSISTDLTKPLIGHKLIFPRKFNARARTIRYKVRLVARGFFPTTRYRFRSNLFTSNKYYIHQIFTCIYSSDILRYIFTRCDNNLFTWHFRYYPLSFTLTRFFSTYINS